MGTALSNAMQHCGMTAPADCLVVGSVPCYYGSTGLTNCVLAYCTRVAYCFGHGESYSKWEISQPVQVACHLLPPPYSKWDGDDYRVCVSANVTNTGPVGGAKVQSDRQVVQLYLEFPDIAGQPAPILKGFHKTTPLVAGESTTVVFTLTQRDISYWTCVTLAP